MLRGQRPHSHFSDAAPHAGDAFLPAAHELEVTSSPIAQTWLRTISDQRLIPGTRRIPTLRP